MGGFFYSSKDAAIDVSGVLAESRTQFERSGFPPPITFDTESYCCDYYPKIDSPAKNYVRFNADNFIIAVGTFIYKNAIGADALRLFYAQDNHLGQLRAARGHFVIIIRKGGQTRLLKDPLGSFEVFLTRELRCVTTSFLAATSVSNQCTINFQETYEYVFNGVTLGDATVFAEIHRLGLYQHMQLEPAPRVIHENSELCPAEHSVPFSESVDRNLQGLLSYASDLAKLFGPKIRIALSGGYDSRFLLALFRRCGITPQIFVYGRQLDQDVTAARQIADGEGIELHHVDKSLLRRVTQEEYPDVVKNNFFHDDALPWGGIFENGAELIARLQRNAGGALHVNGGGGEIFRNFFNLLDRALTARQFVWVFYSRFDPSQCSDLFASNAYEDAIAEKIIALLRVGNTRLSRRQIECLYPHFRCRSWFGRENSINSRWGYSVLPFFDYQTVNSALQVPVRYKYFGNFESCMLRRADPRLASYLSNYGHSFSQDAPFLVAAKDSLTYIRPPWMRQYTFRVKSFLDKSRTGATLLSEPYIGRSIDLRFPYMSKFFKVGLVKSELHFARICTLEYLYGRVLAR